MEKKLIVNMRNMRSFLGKKLSVLLPMFIETSSPACQLPFVFLPPHPTPHLSPLYSASESILPWKIFRGKISISG